MSYRGGGNSGRDNGSDYLTCRVQYLDDTDPFSSTNFPEPTRPPSYTFNTDIPLCEQLAGVHRLLKAPHKIGDCTLQLSNTHNYLDLDLSISEQKEEFESFNSEGKRNSIIIRTQLSVRVHSCIEKLYNSKGRELRRALFSLKQIFQDDKDLVHQFVNADGLTCLIKVGAEADQNYQNYILRALGQIMLYIDGMEGVIRHNDTVRWLYSLIASKFRLVIKTSLKLQLVFVEYAETNAQVLLKAVQYVDSKQRRPMWSNIMDVLGEKDGIDSELLVYAMTLLNKTLSSVPDQDTFYDITDALEGQKMDIISQRHLNKKGNDVDLVEQFKIYEMALKHEDGDEDLSDLGSAGSGINWNRQRTKSEISTERKSKRRNSLTSIPPLDVIEDAMPSNQHKKKEISATPTPKEVPDPTASPKPWLQPRNEQKEALEAPDTTEIQTTPRMRRRGPRRFTSQHPPILTDFRGNSVNSDRNTRLHSSPAAYTSLPSSAVTSSSGDNEERERKRRERLAKWTERERSYRRQIRPTLEDVYQSERLKLERRRNLLKAEMNEKPPISNGYPPSQNGVSKEEDRPGEPPPPPTRTATSKVLEKRKMEKRLQQLQQQEQQEEELRQQEQQKKQEQQQQQLKSSRSPEHVANGDVVRSTRHRRRHHDTTSKPPLPSTAASPAKLNNVETVSQNKTENEKPFSRLDKPPTPTPIPDMQLPPTAPKSNQSSDVITTDQKLLMDMLYANQAVASKQTESDECSDETASTEPSEGAVSVKAMAERLKGSSADLVKRLKPPEPKEEIAVVEPPAPVIKKDSDLMWEKLIAQRDNKNLSISGFDFSGVSDFDDVDVLSPPSVQSPHSGVPPPPPPMFGGVPPPPPIGGPPPPPPPPPGLVPPPPPPMSPPLNHSSPAKRKTVRLFWKEAARIPGNILRNKSTVWDDIDDMEVEPEKFINLFQLKSKDVVQKKQQTEKRNELRVLEVKRSNAINIGLTVLPPPRTIKSAIINMDEFALTKEQIEKLLTMVPTDEEISAIQEGMQVSPDVALGSAEQFLLTLSSISELEARLSLWAFKLDYDILEKEVAEPLQDLKDGIAELKSNKTLRRILATLKSIGNLLNNTSVNGFDISYLTKVPEVKDTVHKQSLLHHVTQCVLEKYPDATDLYSELGALTRCSRVDFDVVQETLQAMESRCKNSWDYLKLIAKHESKAAFRSKVSEFLISCAQNIIALKVIHSRLVNRYHGMLLYFGTSPKAARDTSIQSFARMISEFALEYRTSKERVESQKKKKHQRGERNRTRGKMIMEDNILSDSVISDEEMILTRRFSTTEEQMKQKLMESALKPTDTQVEKRTRSRSNRSRKSNDPSHVISPKHSTSNQPDDVTDQIMEQLVKTATLAPRERSTPVSRRKRSRNTQRKSLRRTLKSGLTDEEKQAVIMGSY